MSRHKRRMFAGLVLPFVMLASLLVATSQPAQAFNYIGCKWSGTSAKFYVTNNDAPDTNFNNARDDWNTRTNQFTLIRTTTAADRDFKARTSNLGVTGWSGKWHKDGNTGATPSCSGGKWVSKDGVVTVNNFYNSGSSQNRRGVAVHEFGHTLGLAHNDLTQACGGAQGYISIMYFSDDRFNGPCAIFVPSNDDLMGIDQFY